METMAVFTLDDEQIIWVDKSSDVNLSRIAINLFILMVKLYWKNRLFRRFVR